MVEWYLEAEELEWDRLRDAAAATATASDSSVS